MLILSLTSILSAQILLLASAWAQSNASIPQYVLDYAPLLYLDVNEEFYPSDIGAQLVHTYPALNFAAITNGSSGLTLSNLSSVNSNAGCTKFANCDIYLTSKDTITVKPSEQWLRGVLPNPITGETEGATSTAVIVRDLQNGTIDAFYMFFYAFNYGIPVGSPNGTVYDDHVGDWEYMMIRFSNGKPLIVYYSQHSGGFSYTYDAVLKNGSRPLGFPSKGGHATYAQEGVHVMYGGAANDSTSRGPLWDPVAGSGAWYYTFTPNNTDGSDGSFQAVDVPNHTARGAGPTDWLHYYGRWGDKQYNSSYPGQNSISLHVDGPNPGSMHSSSSLTTEDVQDVKGYIFVTLANKSFQANLTYVFQGGPTGPLDKSLLRSGTCPDRSKSCLTRSVLEASSGTPISQTVSRTYAPASATSSMSATSSAASQATTMAPGKSAADENHGSPSSTRALAITVVAGLLSIVL